jgi:hypothetical protein
MSRSGTAPGAVVLGLLLCTAPAPAQPGPADGGSASYRDGVLGAISELSQQVQLLQDVLFDEPSARQGRGLFKQTETVMVSLAGLKRQLKSGATRQQLYQAFGDMDATIQLLVGDIGSLGPYEKPLKRAAVRVRAATHDLHFALSYGDGGDARRADVLMRQTLAFDVAAEEFRRVASYLLEGQESADDFGNDFQEIRRTTAAFRKALRRKADAKALQAQFAKVQYAWAELVVDYESLSQSNTMLLQSKAAQLDRIYGRLFALMGQKGYRPTMGGGS